MNMSECHPTAPTAGDPGAVPRGTHWPPAPSTALHPPVSTGQPPQPSTGTRAQPWLGTGQGTWLLSRVPEPMLLRGWTLWPSRSLSAPSRARNAPWEGSCGPWGPRGGWMSSPSLPLPFGAVWGCDICPSPPFRDVPLSPSPSRDDDEWITGTSTASGHPWAPLWGLGCLGRAPAWFPSILGSFLPGVPSPHVCHLPLPSQPQPVPWAAPDHTGWRGRSP